MRTVGRETGFTEEGEAEARRLEAGFERIRVAVENAERTEVTTEGSAIATCVTTKTESCGDVVASTGKEGGVIVADNAKHEEQRIEMAKKTKKKAAFLEWLEPLFNGGHWIPDLVRTAGGDYTMAEPGKSVYFAVVSCQLSVVSW